MPHTRAHWFGIGWVLMLLGGIVYATLATAQSPTDPTTQFASGLSTCPAPLAPVPLVNPTTVTDCTRAGIQAALDQGGHIRFACGTGNEPFTIRLMRLCRCVQAQRCWMAAG